MQSLSYYAFLAFITTIMIGPLEVLFSWQAIQILVGPIKLDHINGPILLVVWACMLVVLLGGWALCIIETRKRYD